MPLIEVTMVEGRSAEQLRALISGLTRAATEAIAAPVETIRVVVREVPATHWAAGDDLRRTLGGRPACGHRTEPTK